MAAPSSPACRLMQPHDWPALLALWENTFGDAPRYASNAIDTFAGVENVLVAQGYDGVAMAMLLAVPCTLAGQKGVYLYALATRPDCRGKGVMAGLMAESDSLAAFRGAAFSVLIPASKKLYGYYRRHGYDNTLYLRHLSLEAMPDSTADVRFETPTADGIAQLRQRWLAAPIVAFAGESARMAAQDVADAEAFIAEGPRGYAVCLAENGVLLAVELAAQDDEAAKGILAAAMAKTGCKSLRLTLPKASPLFAEQGALQPAAVLKALADDFHFDEDTYLRFAMDEAFRFDLPDG